MSRVLSSGTAVGLRDYQEDRYLSISAEEGLVLMIADGHGGASCSDTIAKAFPKVWADMWDGFKNPIEALIDVFATIDNLTRQNRAGSTLTVVFIPKTFDTAYVAICGDSPVIINQPDGTLWVSPEHNVRTNIVERDLAIRRGGIYERGYIWNDSPYSDNARGLQMSRAMGDPHMGSRILHLPEIKQVPLGDWLLAGSDGLVDPGHVGGEGSSTPEKMAEMIDGGADADELVDFAVKLPTHDNVTAILWRRN